MAITITSAYVSTFESTVRHLAQQPATKLRPWVQERSVSSKEHNWETMGKQDMVDKTTARVATPTNDSPWGRRVSTTGTKHIGDTVEQEDPVQMLVDPNSNIARSQAMAARRAQDDVIIAAATGDALLGSGSTLSFPAGQKIGDGTVPISFDYITAVQQKFMANDIDPSVPKCFVIGPTQVQKLMQLTEQTNKDYVRKGLDQLSSNGVCEGFMGFDWIMSTRLLAPGAGELSTLAFTRDAIGMQVNRDITSRVAEDPSISFAWRIYTYQTLGAVRVEDEQIVHLHVKDALS